MKGLLHEFTFFVRKCNTVKNKLTFTRKGVDSLLVVLYNNNRFFGIIKNEKEFYYEV